MRIGLRCSNLRDEEFSANGTGSRPSPTTSPQITSIVAMSQQLRGPAFQGLNVAKPCMATLAAQIAECGHMRAVLDDSSNFPACTL